MPVIVEVLAAAGVAMAWAAGYEADDIIGTLAAQATPSRSRWSPATGTCSSSSTTRAASGSLYIARGLAKLEVVDEAAVTATYQIPGRAYAAFAALRGDPSDGLPGVPGRGGEDGRGPGPRVRLGRGDAGRARRRPRRLPGGQPGQAGRGRGRTWTPACRWSGWPPTPRSSSRAASCRPRPADPGRLAELDERWDLGSSLGRAAVGAGRGLTPRPRGSAAAGLEDLQRDQAGVVLGVGAAQRAQRRGDDLAPGR